MLGFMIESGHGLGYFRTLRFRGKTVVSWFKRWDCIADHLTGITLFNGFDIEYKHEAKYLQIGKTLGWNLLIGKIDTDWNGVYGVIWPGWKPYLWQRWRLKSQHWGNGVAISTPFLSRWNKM